MAQRRAYDRLPDESSKAYDAFAVYRDMGVNRSTYDAGQKLGKSIAVIQRWSTLHNWVERAAAYDDHVDAEARKLIERDAIRRKADMLKRHADIGRGLQSFGLQYLKDKKKPDKAVDAINSIKSGVEMERKSEGLPEYLIEVMNADDDELARQYNALLAQIGGGGSGDEAPGDSDTGTGDEADPTG